MDWCEPQCNGYFVCAHVWNHARASTRQMKPPEIIQGQGCPPYMPQQRHISCKARSKFILIHILGGKQNVSSSSLLPPSASDLLYVEDKPKDKADKGPVTPEAQPQSVTSIHDITAAYKKKKKRWDLVVDFLLKETEDLICQEGPTRRKVCCLPYVKDLTRRLPSLVWPMDYCLVLIFSVGCEEVETHSLRAIKKFQSLWTFGMGILGTSYFLLYF